MAIDWTKPVCTKHETPHIGQVLPDCMIHGRKRVGIYSPSALGSQPTNDESRTTVFRYDIDGTTRGDGQPSLNDLVNYDAEDGAVRLDLNGRKVLCSARAA
jgi:hypothetical protein